MTDQDDLGQTLTPSQEYTIAFVVIGLFGLMYWFFTHGSKPYDSTALQASGSQQVSQAQTTNHSVSEAKSKGLQARTSERSDSLDNNGAKTLVDNTSILKGAEPLESQPAEGQTLGGTQQTKLRRDDARLKVEAAELAAATSAQKIADEKRFNESQQALQAGKAKLVIPPLAAAAKPQPIQPDPLPLKSPKKTPESSAFNLSDELNRVNFKLPDGRTIQIPGQGFENEFKRSILQSNNKQTIVFDRVSFFSGSDLLNPESSNQILGVAGILNTYKDINIKLRGHTDSTGSSDENLTLSFQRSLNLKKQLVNLGINGQRVQVEGLGASEPISDNGSEKGRNKNRRIDLTIIR